MAAMGTATGMDEPPPLPFPWRWAREAMRDRRAGGGARFGIWGWVGVLSLLPSHPCRAGFALAVSPHDAVGRTGGHHPNIMLGKGMQKSPLLSLPGRGARFPVPKPSP